MLKHLLFAEQSYSIPILRAVETECVKRGDTARWLVAPSLRNHQDLASSAVMGLQQARYWQPDSVIAPGNWAPPELGGIQVQVFHGLGIEKRGHFKIRGMFDLYCTHGPLTSASFFKAAERHRYFSVVETGWPKFDPYGAVQVKSANATKIGILFAPTFSRRLTCAHRIVEDIRKLCQNPWFRVSAKFHPLMDHETIQRYSAIENLCIIDRADILPEIAASHLVISDTSSAVQEALYLGRPVIAVNGMARLDGIVHIESPANLEAAVLHALSNYEGLAKHAIRATALIHPFRDGKSAGRVLDAVAQLRTNPRAVKRKPINLLRRIKIARTLRRWQIQGEYT